MSTLNIVEATITDLQSALSSGTLTSVELVSLYLQRIATYDTRGPTLNSIPILNPSAFAEAAASDAYRLTHPLRPLEGIPYTVKDSYAVANLTVASGSPAFQSLRSHNDAFTIARLRAAGAVLLGKTNMPPMAAGGMQRGVYGRAESPYNAEYLTAAFASGSSNGSATATAASFAAFGMGEETVSSGRSPASNNGLVAYTPSKGLISIRGNWPLYVTCDVIVPHTRTMEDMFTVLDVIAVEDPVTDGDFWRHQTYVPLPSISSVRPRTYHSLSTPCLKGKRIGIPKIYINEEPSASPIQTRPSILALWATARADLESLGATVVPCAFPAVTNYEKQDFPGQAFNVPGVRDGWNATERGELIAYAWDAFLRSNADPKIPSLAAVDAARIYPSKAGDVQVKYSEIGNAIRYSELVGYVQDEGSSTSLYDIEGLGDACKALEAARKRDLEDWMRAEGLDLMVFPANADVGNADADTSDRSAKMAWRNGVKYSNGGRAIRHLGIPTATVTMGRMEDTGMPVGLTFAGPAYSDNELLAAAAEFEGVKERRGGGPERTPALDSDIIKLRGLEQKERISTGEAPRISDFLCEIVSTGRVRVVGSIEGQIDAVEIIVDGMRVPGVTVGSNGQFTVEADTVPTSFDEKFKTEAKVARDQSLVVILARGKGGRVSGAMKLVEWSI